MKRPWLAFVLNFILPGAGFAYLGRWRMALLNFAIVHAILAALLLVELPPSLSERFYYVVLALAAASGGIAHATADSQPQAK